MTLNNLAAILDSTAPDDRPLIIQLSPDGEEELRLSYGAGRARIAALARGKWRHTILRAYWDGQKNPSIETPCGDFFCVGWEDYAQVNALPVNVNPLAPS